MITVYRYEVKFKFWRQIQHLLCGCALGLPGWGWNLWQAFQADAQQAAQSHKIISGNNILPPCAASKVSMRFEPKSHS